MHYTWQYLKFSLMQWKKILFLAWKGCTIHALFIFPDPAEENFLPWSSRKGALFLPRSSRKGMHRSGIMIRRAPDKEMSVGASREEEGRSRIHQCFCIPAKIFAIHTKLVPFPWTVKYIDWLERRKHPLIDLLSVLSCFFLSLSEPLIQGHLNSSGWSTHYM